MDSTLLKKKTQSSSDEQHNVVFNAPGSENAEDADSMKLNCDGLEVTSWETILKANRNSENFGKFENFEDFENFETFGNFENCDFASTRPPNCGTGGDF